MLSYSDLPKECRQRIIEYAAPWLFKDTFFPTYNEGSVHGAATVMEIANIDTSLLNIGNKEWYDDARAVLYGRNTFHFDHAQKFRWWIERIGHRNFVALRHLSLRIGTAAQGSGWGMVPPKGQENPPEELLWRRVLLPLRSVQQLESLNLDFSAWETDEGLEAERWARHGRWREELIVFLYMWRGVREVTVKGGLCHPKSDSTAVWRWLERTIRLNPGSRSSGEQAFRSFALRQREKWMKGKSLPTRTLNPSNSGSQITATPKPT